MLFGEDSYLILPANATMVDIVVAAGFMPSKAQVRKNSVLRRWEGEKDTFTKVKASEEEVQPGFREYVIGKLNHNV